MRLTISFGTEGASAFTTKPVTILLAPGGVMDTFLVFTEKP
jgi:hypothetical protein